MTESRRYLQALFAACFFILAVVSVLYLAFLDRTISFDEVGLQNPPYMLLHYGRLTYPVHLHFDDMVIHPPTHYLVLALFMELGLSLFHAAAVMPVLFFLLAGFLLLSSRMSFPVKFGLLFGTFLGAMIWNPTLTVRPEVALCLAWIAGLIALESGRLADWDPKRLFAGSLLLAYAAAMHYPAAFCWTGVVIYAIWVSRSLPSRQALRRIAVMCAGLALIGIPYLLLFLIPFRHEISEVVNQHQGAGGPLEALHRHFDAYATWWNERALDASFQPLVQTLLLPLWRLRLPAAFIGPPLLFAFRSTRGLALAALPQLLFILLGARHKEPKFAGYFAPEMIVYLAAVIGVVLAGCFALLSRIPRIASKILVLCVLAALTAAALHDHPSVTGRQLRFTRNLNDLDLARAAAQAITGPNAFIGSTSLGVWYTGGAAHFYNVSPEILYPPTLAGADLPDYFRRFDALVIDQLDSWMTWNKERINLTSLYLSGDLRLKGFWFGDRRSNPESGLSWMMYSANENAIQGYAARDGQMYRFEPAQDGDSVFYSAVCPFTDLNNSGQFDFYATLFVPLQANADPRSFPPYSESTPVIRMLLVTKQQLQRDVLPLAARCKVRDQIVGRVARVAKLTAIDRTIRFYRSFAEALAGADRLNARNTSEIPGVIALNDIAAVNPQSHVSRRAASVDVRTSHFLWWDAAASPIDRSRSVARGFLHLRGRVLDGVVGISIRGKEQNAILGSEAVWGVHDGVGELYLPFASFPDSYRVVIRNQRWNAESEVLLDDMAVVTQK